MSVSIIVAISENNVIGRAGELPWHLSSDLRRFKRLTMGHHILMGRRTFESIGRLLPGRRMIVVTRKPNYDVDGLLVARSIDDALHLAQRDDEAFVIGGADIFRLAVPLTKRIYLTRVHVQLDGDVFFPDIDWSQWHCVSEEFAAADQLNEFDHTFRILEEIEQP